MNRIRKIGSHFRRHRGKYILGVATILILVLYAQKRESDAMVQELLDDITELDVFHLENPEILSALVKWRNS